MSVLAVMVSAAAACSDSSSTGGTETCAAPSTVTIAAFPAGVTLSTDMAVALGAFKEVETACKTKINIATYDAPANMLAGLLSGQIQYAIPSAPNIVNAAAQGRTLVNVATLSQGGSGVMVTSPDKPINGTGVSAIKSIPPTDSWGVTSLKGLSELYIRALIGANGGDPKAPQLVALGSSAIASAVATGNVDNGYLPAIPASQLIANGQAKEVLNPSGPAAYELVGFVASWSLTATPEFTAQYPELSARIAAAELKGVHFLQDNFTKPEAVYKLMPATFTSTTSLVVFSQAWSWNVSAFVTTGLAPIEDLRGLGEKMAKYGLMDAFDPSTITERNVVPDIQNRTFELLGIPVPSSDIDLELLKTAAN